MSVLLHSLYFLEKYIFFPRITIKITWPYNDFSSHWKLSPAFQAALVVKNLPVNAGNRSGFGPWVRKFLWRRAWQPTPVFLLGESHGQRSLAGYIPCCHKESDTTEVTYHTYSNPYLESCPKGIQEALLDKMQGEGASWGHLLLHILSYADCDGLCVNQDKSWEISAGKWLVFYKSKSPLFAIKAPTYDLWYQHTYSIVMKSFI